MEKNAFCSLLNVQYPIIAGPMFLVSDENLVAAVSNAGGIGGMPSLNWRSTADFRAAVRKVKELTKGKPFAVNLIVNKSNIRVKDDLKVCADEGVPLVITSLGSPKETIQTMHKVGSKVFCDVTSLDYAKKVEQLGADGLIAVCAGAGGHAGALSPLVFLPYLRQYVRLPIVAAGGITHGSQIAASFVLGASAVQIGTRFIASKEANVDQKYKNAIINAKAEDIVLTMKISGTPASVIKTPYIEKVGLELNPLESFLMKNQLTKKYTKLARGLWGAKLLQSAARTTTWKEVWSAGQGVGLIEEILPAKQIIERLIDEYQKSEIPSLS
ncbi:MAG: nitronate monooxygenase [Oligoflexia bacterium]|nr:nitronate monooxygenase [Oligoflexia bacterium]